MRTRAVIFDLFGTLVPQFPPKQFEASLAAMAKAVKMDCEEFAHSWINETNLRRHMGQFPSFYEEISWICEKKGIVPLEKELDEAIRLRYEFTRSMLKPRSDALQTLENLKAMELFIGLISDCSKEVPEMWAETPFYSFFDVPIFSCSVGIKKPNPKIFALACSKLEVKAKECIYVGDGFSQELAGAKSSGMRPFLLLPPDEKRPESASWEGQNWKGETISSLSEIVALAKKKLTN